MNKQDNIEMILSSILKPIPFFDWQCVKYLQWKKMLMHVSFGKVSSPIIKGYLRYKMLTSQKVPPKAQIKNFFISYKNYVLFSRYSSFCIFNHPMIYQISDITMSISTWDKVHFWIYLLNHKSWSHQTWPVGRYKQGQ